MRLWRRFWTSLNTRSTVAEYRAARRNGLGVAAALRAAADYWMKWL